MKRYLFILLALLLVLVGCQKDENTSDAGTGGGEVTGLPADAAAVVAERGLTPDDVYAAVTTYMPTGQLDHYIMFASGGQSGQVLVIDVPSMRILKIIGLFTPRSWQGYCLGGGRDVILEGGFEDQDYPLFWS